MERDMKHLKTITDLDRHGCRWPVAMSQDGTHLFCNEQQRENSPYCPDHHMKAYAGAPPKKTGRPYVFR
jgi:hypothetical protein